MAAARQTAALPPLFKPRTAAAQAFDVAAVLFALDPLALLGLGYLGGAARHRPYRRLPDQFEQPLARVGAVAGLIAVLLGDDDDDALFGEPLARKPHQPD